MKKTEQTPGEGIVQTEDTVQRAPTYARRSAVRVDVVRRKSVGAPAMTTAIKTTRSVRFNADGYYTIKEVATILNVSTRSVERWIAAGKLKAFRLGGEPGAPVRVHGRTILALLKRVEKITAQRKDEGGGS